MPGRQIGSHESAKLARKQRSLASVWRYSPALEQALFFRDQHREVYDRLPAGVKVKLGHYLSSKAAAEAEGIDTRSPQEQADSDGDAS